MRKFIAKMGLCKFNTLPTHPNTYPVLIHTISTLVVTFIPSKSGFKIYLNRQHVFVK